MNTPTMLWHYTCEHSLAGIRRDGRLRPFPHPLLPEPLVWLTDLDAAWPEALGLTSRVQKCDRTAHRFQAASTATAAPWLRYRRRVQPEARGALESAPGAMPAHWWISTSPVPIVSPNHEGAPHAV